MQYEVVGVQFKQVGKKYFFDPNGFELKKGDYVLVETVRGMEFGTVVIAPKLVVFTAKTCDANCDGRGY